MRNISTKDLANSIINTCNLGEDLSSLCYTLQEREMTNRIENIYNTYNQYYDLDFLN